MQKTKITGRLVNLRFIQTPHRALRTDSTLPSRCGVHFLRSNSLRYLLLLLGLFVVQLNPVLAADPSETKQTEIKGAIKNLQLEPSLGKDQPLCRSFYEDFKNQSGIEYLKPIVQANSYDDPALKPYKDKCPMLQLNKTIAFEPRNYEYAIKLPEEVQEQIGYVSYGISNFKVYEVNINNNPKDGDEYVFYYEGERSKKGDTYPTRIYRIVDLKSCKFLTSIAFNQSGDPKWTQNAIIRYQNKNYIYTLQSMPGIEPQYYRLALSEIPKDKDGVHPACTYGPPKKSKPR